MTELVAVDKQFNNLFSDRNNSGGDDNNHH